MNRIRFSAYVPVVAFISAMFAAIWLPGIVLAQQHGPDDPEWRFSADEKAMLALDDRVRQTEEKIVGLDSWAKREEPRVAELEKSAEELHRLGAVLDFIKWEFTVCAAGLGAFLLWIVNWILRTFRQLRQSQRDDYQSIAVPLIKLLEKDHPEVAEELQDRMLKRDGE